MQAMREKIEEAKQKKIQADAKHNIHE